MVEKDVGEVHENETSKLYYLPVIKIPLEIKQKRDTSMTTDLPLQTLQLVQAIVL